MSALPGAAGTQARPIGDYEAFTTFLRRHAGIDLTQHRRRQMERRIRAFAGRLGVTSLIEYATRLADDEQERSALLDRLAGAGSQLFSSPEQWQRVARTVVPELVETGHGRIRAWSAGCARGADAYSLVATVFSACPEARIEVRATDVDRRVLSPAWRGGFTAEDVRSAPTDLLDAHFVATADEAWRPGPALTSAVHFHHEDLLAVEPAPAGYDLVMCRNVVASLTRAARDDVHVRTARSLRRGGYLVIGPTECIDRPLDEIGLESVSPCTYRKVR